MPSVTAPQTASQNGAFTPDVFAAHLAVWKNAPAWWLDRKRAAWEKFASLPMPRRTDESWRFSNIGGIKLDGYAPPQKVERVALNALVLGQTAVLTFVNNRPAGTIVRDLPKGVIVTTLADAVLKHADLLKAHFMAQPQRLGSEKFAALHTALIGDGAFIYVPRGGELPTPVVISHRAAGAGASVFPHTLVIAEENSRATVIDMFASEEDCAHFAVGANDLYAGHGAQLTYIGAQSWSRETLSFQLNSTVVRRDARVQSLNVHLGGCQARHESLSQLQAPGAFSEMLAVTVAQGTQEFDQRTLQIHQAPNTKSDLLYKNALLDQARTIFSGLIIVDPDAQKTDAYQSNRNLMLSDDAEAQSLPGLEIQANDVRCTHGATTGRIDPEQMFYLESRGIAPPAARELLTFAFFEEVLDRLVDEKLHSNLSELIRTRFRR